MRSTTCRYLGCSPFLLTTCIRLPLGETCHLFCHSEELPSSVPPFCLPMHHLPACCILEVTCLFTTVVLHLLRCSTAGAHLLVHSAIPISTISTTDTTTYHSATADDRVLPFYHSDGIPLPLPFLPFDGVHSWNYHLILPATCHLFVALLGGWVHLPFPSPRLPLMGVSAVLMQACLPPCFPVHFYLFWEAWRPVPGMRPPPFDTGTILRCRSTTTAIPATTCDAMHSDAIGYHLPTVTTTVMPPLGLPACYHPAGGFLPHHLPGR